MKKIIGVLIMTLILGSCKKQEQLGPDLEGIYGPVEVVEPLTVSAPSVNFATGESVFFSAKFKSDAIWTLTIKQGTLGTVKVFTGVSKEINASNSTWKGTADALPSFIAGSTTATLTFKSSAHVETVPVSITAKRVSDLPGDVLVTNFVTTKIQNYAPGVDIDSAKWASDGPYTGNANTMFGFPDGNKYLFMGNVAPAVGNGPYIDLVIISARNCDTPYGKVFPLYADPSKVYFNMMVYNTGTPTWLEIGFFEEGINEAVRTLTLKPNWTGWKLISVKYSDLIPTKPEYIGNIRPQKITDIRFVLLSTAPAATLNTTPASTAFDHITFTHNAPYQP